MLYLELMLPGRSNWLKRMPRLHLFDLPVELLESILFFLPPVLFVTRVSATCRQLRDLLQSESFEATLRQPRPRHGAAAGGLAVLAPRLRAVRVCPHSRSRRESHPRPVPHWYVRPLYVPLYSYSTVGADSDVCAAPSVLLLILVH